MSAPMTDLHLSYVIKLGLKTIRSNPEKYLKDIFADTQLGPHAAIYGKTAQQAADWIKKTEVPIMLGFDLSEAQLPAVTVHLSASSAEQPFVGDEGIGDGYEEDLGFQQKEVLVPSFQPKGFEPALDPNKIPCMKLTLPDAMPFEMTELFLPGLKLRDAANREYFIGRNDDGDILISQASDKAPLAQIDLTSLEVVSPVIQARFSRGHMQYNETATIVVHGMANRQEGLWLYYIVMWTLLKFRPVLTGLLGLDLSTPSASDYSKDDTFLGENVWRRFITVNARTAWTWENAQKQDILGLILTVTEGRQGDST